MNENLSNDDIWKNYSHLTPKKITELLRTKGGIVGQDSAVKAASMIMYNHIHGRASVNLFAAPSGSGKSYLWSVLQREFGADKIVIHDGSSLSSEGFKGVNISTIFKNIPQEQRNQIVVVMDELDKLLAPQYGASGTNYSEMLQNQLLRLCNHDTLFFNSGENEKGFYVDASGISVVMLGAFQRLLDRKSRSSSLIGFGGQPHRECTYDNTEITYEDLINYGMVKELAGRITRITCMRPLSVEDLTRIGQQEIRNLEQHLKRKISADYNVIFNLAYKASEKGFGARFVTNQISNAIDDLLYDNPHAEHFVLDFNTLDVNDYKKSEASME